MVAESVQSRGLVAILKRARVHLFRDFRSYFLVVFFSGFTSLLSFIAAAILARELGPARFGEFALFYGMLQIFWTATNFGDSTYVRYVNTSPEEDSTPYLRAAFAIELIAAILLAALSYPLAAVLASYVFDKPDYVFPVCLGILAGTGLNLISLVAAIHQARENFRKYAVLNTFFYGVATASVVILALVSKEIRLPAVYLVYVGTSAIVFALSFRRLYKLTKPFSIDRPLARRMLAFGKWLIAGNITYLLYQRADIILIARFASRYDVGQYGAALRIAVIASLFTGSIAPFLLPRASRTRGSVDSARRYVKQTILLTSLLIVLIGGLALAAPFVIRILFGSAYAPAATLTRVLLLASVCIALYTPLSQLFLAEDNPSKRFYLGVVKLVTTLVLLFILAPRYGAIGGAWSLVGAEAASLLYTALALRPALKRTS